MFTDPLNSLCDSGKHPYNRDWSKRRRETEASVPWELGK